MRRQVDPQYDKGTYVLGGLLEPLVAAIVEGRPGKRVKSLLAWIGVG